MPTRLDEVVGTSLELHQNKALFAFFQKHDARFFPGLSCVDTILKQFTDRCKGKCVGHRSMASAQEDLVVNLDAYQQLEAPCLQLDRLIA